MSAGTFDIPLRQRLLLQEGIFLFFVITKCGAGCQLVVAAEFLRDQLLERLIGFFPRGVFNIFKGQKNHRILSTVGKIGFSAEPDFLVSEVNGGVLGRLFEESAELSMFNVLPKRLGRVNKDTFGRSSRNSLIIKVLST